MNNDEHLKIKALLKGLLIPNEDSSIEIDSNSLQEFYCLNSGWCHIYKSNTTGMDNLATSFNIVFDTVSPIEKTSKTVYNHSIKPIILFSLKIADIKISEHFILEKLMIYKGNGNNFYVNLNDAINIIITEMKRQEILLSQHIIKV